MTGDSTGYTLREIFPGLGRLNTVDRSGTFG